MKWKTMLLAPLLGLAVLLPAAAAEQPVVLFDQGHGQMFVIGRDGPLQLSALATAFDDGGFTVRSAASPLSDDALAGVDALVISGPFAPFADAEIDAVARFVERGGRLAVMLHIGPPVVDLLHRLGVDVANGVIRESEHVLGGNPLDFAVIDLAEHPIFAGLERFAAFGAWPVMAFGEGAAIVAATGPRAWVDRDGDGQPGEPDVVQSFGVAVAGRLGKGRFVVFGDDAIFQNRFLGEHNVALAENLVDWLGAE